MFAGVKTTATDEVRIVEICKQFNWTYQEYENTPQWFIETVRIRKAAEAYFNQKETRKLKAQTRFSKHR